MKTCKKCGESKPIEEFYKHPKNIDGHSGTCKDCVIHYTQSKYERKRPITPPGQKWCGHCKQMKPVEEFGVDAGRASKRGGSVGRQAYCKECWPRYQKFRRDNPEVRFMDSQKQIAHRKTPKGKQHHYARQLTWLAIKFGYLVPQPCEVCGTTELVQPHHTQYEKPLDGIRWLCEAHHLSHGHDGDWTKPPV